MSTKLNKAKKPTPTKNGKYPLTKPKTYRTSDGYKIERGVPIPFKRSVVGRRYKYPFHKMKVKEDLFVPYTKLGSNVFSVLSSARHFCKNHQPEWDFESRRYEDGIRIWRIK